MFQKTFCDIFEKVVMMPTSKQTCDYEHRRPSSHAYKLFEAFGCADLQFYGMKLARNFNVRTEISQKTLWLSSNEPLCSSAWYHVQTCCMMRCNMFDLIPEVRGLQALKPVRRSCRWVDTKPVALAYHTTCWNLCQRCLADIEQKTRCIKIYLYSGISICCDTTRTISSRIQA